MGGKSRMVSLEGSGLEAQVCSVDGTPASQFSVGIIGYGRLMRKFEENTAHQCLIYDYGNKRHSSKSPVITDFNEFYQSSSALVLAAQAKSPLTEIVEEALDHHLLHVKHISLEGSKNDNHHPFFRWISCLLKRQGISQQSFLSEFPLLDHFRQRLHQSISGCSDEEKKQRFIEYEFFEEIIKMKQDGYFPEGGLLVDNFPYSAPLVIDYAHKARKAFNKHGPKTIIIASNEPVALANLFSMVAPELAKQVIAFTAFGKETLKREVNKDLNTTDLEVAVIGDGDAYAIPVPYHHAQLGRQELQNLTTDQLLAWRDKLIFDIQMTPPEDAQEGTIQSLEKLLTGLHHSQGFALTRRGEYTNGYFQESILPGLQDGDGLFCVGRHSLLDGRPEQIETRLVSAIKELATAGLLAHKELIARCQGNDIIARAIGSKCWPHHQKRESSGIGQLAEKTTLYVSAGTEVRWFEDVGVGDLVMNQPPRQFDAGTLVLANHIYTALYTFDINKVEYICAARRNAVDIANCKRGENGGEKEQRTISFSMGANREGYRYLGVVGKAQSLEQCLVIVHDNLGVLKVPVLELSHAKDGIVTINPQNIERYLVTRPDGRTAIRTRIANGQLYVSRGDTLFTEEGLLKKVSLATIPEGEITAFDVDEAGTIFAGSSSGMVFHNYSLGGKMEPYRTCGRRPVAEILCCSGEVFMIGGESTLYQNSDQKINLNFIPRELGCSGDTLYLTDSRYNFGSIVGSQHDPFVPFIQAERSIQHAHLTRR